MPFSTRLKEARKEVELSGTELGDRLDPPVSKQTVSHWENGSHRPDIGQLEQLCSVLDTTADALVLGAMKRHTPEAHQIATLIDDLSKAERIKWLEILRMATRPHADQDRVIDATPPRPITSFDKLK